MIACVSPSVLNYEESLNTLKYAERALKITKNITKNVKETELHPSEYKKVINSLKNEINNLRFQLTN
jgi:kinesin family protein 18/19